jgi:hypothetical protein
LSLLSKVCRVVNNEFVHFQERPGLYPAHLSALLECDLRRIARESGWTDVAVAYTAEGRMPGTARHWPQWLPAREGWRGRAFSDNVVLSARRPVMTVRICLITPRLPPIRCGVGDYSVQLGNALTARGDEVCC